MFLFLKKNILRYIVNWQFKFVVWEKHILRILAPPLGADGNLLAVDATGLLLRRGDHELVLALLQMVEANHDDAPPASMVAELVLFRSGEWSVERPLINHHSRWYRSEGAGVLVGDRHLCWVDCSRAAPSCTARAVPRGGGAPPLRRAVIVAGVRRCT
jgi:hypothetical protein